MIALVALLSFGLIAGLLIDSSDDDALAPVEDDTSEPEPGETTPPGDLIEGTAANDALIGSSSGESLAGRGGNDDIRGLAGNDRIFGDGGNDSLQGGFGNDLVSGGSGNDQMTGSEGNDTVFGGNGDDIVIDGLGGDTIDGGAGDDVLWSSFFEVHPVFGTILSDSDTEADVVDGGDGDDTLLFGRGDTVTGGSGADDLYAGHWLETTEAATITDFEQGEDQIIYGYNPSDGPAPRLTVEDRANEAGGSDAIVFADGVEVLRVLNQDGQFDPSRDIRLFADGGIPIS